MGFFKLFWRMNFTLGNELQCLRSSCEITYQTHCINSESLPWSNYLGPQLISGWQCCGKGGFSNILKFLEWNIKLFSLFPYYKIRLIFSLVISRLWSLMYVYTCESLDFKEGRSVASEWCLYKLSFIPQLNNNCSVIS